MYAHFQGMWYIILLLLLEDPVIFLHGVGMHSEFLSLLFSPLDLFLDKEDKVLIKF